MPSPPNLFDVDETENEFFRLRCSLAIKRRAGPGGRMLRSAAAGHELKVLTRTDLAEANDLYLEPPVPAPNDGDGRDAADRPASGPSRACLGFDESRLGGDLGPGQGYMFDVRLLVDLVDPHRSFVEFEFAKMPEEGSTGALRQVGGKTRQNRDQKRTKLLKNVGEDGFHTGSKERFEKRALVLGARERSH